MERTARFPNVGQTNIDPWHPQRTGLELHCPDLTQPKHTLPETKSLKEKKNKLNVATLIPIFKKKYKVVSVLF